MGLSMIKPSLLICVLAATLFAQQSTLHKKDIATIAKEANGAVVSIVMSDKEGHPVAQGSGFLISKDGQVVTNYHVIKSGTSAVIKLPDGAFFAIDGVLASDKDRDVAIIKAHGNNFRTLTLGDSDHLQVGEEVVAIGNPLSLESTVSNGIVSAIRTVEDEGGKFVQITAPISPGSSGGPLFNMAGEVVGITTSHIKGGENLNFAIPIDDVKPMIGSSISKVRTGAGVASTLPDEAQPTTAEPVTAEQTTSPTLSKTDEWINRTFNDLTTGWQSVSYYGEHIPAEKTGFTNPRTGRDNPVPNWNDKIYTEYSLTITECRAALLITTADLKIDLEDHMNMTEKRLERVVFWFNLGDIDPSSISITPNEIWQRVTFSTHNNADLIIWADPDNKAVQHKTQSLQPLSVNYYGGGGLNLTPEYAPHFIKAFKHAVELCGGGKPVTF
jgi:S1-C subfamily serine protease